MKLRQVEESLGKQVRMLQEKVGKLEEALRDVRAKVVTLESGGKEKEEKKGKLEKKGKGGKRR